MGRKEAYFMILRYWFCRKYINMEQQRNICDAIRACQGHIKYEDLRQQKSLPHTFHSAPPSQKSIFCGADSHSLWDPSKIILIIFIIMIDDSRLQHFIVLY